MASGTDLHSTIPPGAPDGAVVRSPELGLDGAHAADWHPRLPEFAAGANAISLLMPHAEPYIISVVRRAADDADESVARRARVWAGQEASHHRMHRSFNRALTERSRVARQLDRVGAWMFRMLRYRSPAFGLAFAVAFELIAFSSARWVDRHQRALLEGADESSASLFLWHLAEEVEHKGVVHDVFASTPEARGRYTRALIVAFLALIGFTTFGGLALFLTTRQAWNPIRWLRLVGWGLSLAFVLMPVLVTSTSRTFHPDQLVDPPWMKQWLAEYDPRTRTLPLWTRAGSG